MTDNSSESQEFVGKKVIDTTGRIIGKCLEVVEGEDAHLIIEIETKNDGMKKSKIPMETIQGVGEMIILNVEVEGVVKDDEVVELKDDNDEVNEKDTKTREEEGNEKKDVKNEKKSKEKTWILYKSIKTEEH